MWKTLCYEVRGSVHTDVTIPCQDKAIASTDFGVNVICLADGCNDSKISHFGSNIVTKRATEYISLNFEKLYKEDEYVARKNIMKYVLDSLEKQSSIMGCNIEELASTLLVVAVKDSRYLALFLGDGIIGYYDDGIMKVLLSQKVDKQNFTTSEDAVEAMLIKKGYVNDIKGFTLMSAPTAESLYQEDSECFAAEVGLAIVATAKSKEDISIKLKEAFEDYVIKRTKNDCSVAILVVNSNSSKYYYLNEEEKVKFFKFPTTDRNSVNRVRDLDNILNLIDKEVNIDKLASLLDVKVNFLKRKMDILVETNLLTFSKENTYKRIN